MLTQIALTVLERQSLSNASEVIVIPDCNADVISDLVQHHGKIQGVYPVFVKKLSMKSRLAIRLARNPNMNHYAQIIEGVSTAQGEYVLLHDADLFIRPGDFLENYYDAIVSRGIDVIGVTRREWGGAQHLVATWEMMAKRDWFQRFPPFYHKGHIVNLGGRLVMFDTTLYPQHLTQRERIGLYESAVDVEFVHFHYVISIYRRYAQVRKLQDPKFYTQLLLIRLLLDAYEIHDSSAIVPGVEDYVASWEGESLVIPRRFFDDRERYYTFRDKVRKLLSFGILPEHASRRIAENMALIDQCFGL